MNKQQAYKIAAKALEEKRSVPKEHLISLTGSKEETTVVGPDGRTYIVEVRIEKSSDGAGARVTAVVDLGSSYKLERIEESVEIRAG